MIILFLIGVAIQGHSLKKTKEQLEKVTINYKALEEEIFSLNKENKQYLFTIDELTNSKDSVVLELNKTRKQLKIKDKQLKDLGYLLSTASKTDTLYIRDTIFQKDVLIDTTITDNKWYSTELRLEYPNEIIVSPTFISEKELFFYTRKEILNPSSCWFVNLFKKKTDIIEVVVEEKNPYIKNNKQKFIHITQ